MSAERTRFSAMHPPCGTEVETDLPPGYPVDEGVGLWCPACEQAFWHEPGGAVEAPASSPPMAEERRRSSLRPAGVVAIVAVLGLAVWAASLLGSEEGEPVTSRATPSPAVTATPSPAPTPTGVPIGGRQVILDQPAGWIVRTSPAGALIHQTPRGSGRVTVSARELRGRSLARLGRDARANLRRELRRHRISGPTPVDLNGRRALRVTARRGADAHELTVLAAGDQRFVIVLDLRPTAPRAVRRAGRRVADSATIR